MTEVIHTLQSYQGHLMAIAIEGSDPQQSSSLLHTAGSVTQHELTSLQWKVELAESRPDLVSERFACMCPGQRADGEHCEVTGVAAVNPVNSDAEVCSDECAIEYQYQLQSIHLRKLLSWFLLGTPRGR
jgi:predicted nucleic acid-binding Zn ribbon protein